MPPKRVAKKATEKVAAEDTEVVTGSHDGKSEGQLENGVSSSTASGNKSKQVTEVAEVAEEENVEVDEKALVKPPSKRGAAAKKDEEKTSQESAEKKSGDSQPTKKTATNDNKTAINGEKTVSIGEKPTTNGEKTATNGEKTVTNGEVAEETKKVSKEKAPKKVASDGERRVLPPRAAKDKK